MSDDLTILKAEVKRQGQDIQELKTNHAVEQVHRLNVVSRLTSIEGTLTWLVRLVIGALLLAVIAYLTGGGFVLP